MRRRLLLSVRGKQCTAENLRVELIGIAKSMKTRVPSFGPVVCLLVLSCSNSASLQIPDVVLDTPMGVTPLYTPAPTARYGLALPPPGLQSGLPISPQITDRSGSYAGTAQPLSTDLGACINTLKVSGFLVRGNSVRFGGFHGTIAADSGLQMAYGQQWVIGQFEGASFHGQLNFPGRFGPGCTYMLTLERVGP